MYTVLTEYISTPVQGVTSVVIRARAVVLFSVVVRVATPFEHFVSTAIRIPNANFHDSNSTHA